MKKMTTAAFLLVLAFACQKSFSQEKDSIVTLPTVTVTAVNKVNEAVDQSFRKGFPDAKHLRWYKINKDYLASFIKEDMKHQTLFQKNGYIKYDVSYGRLHDLPVTIADQVMGAYNGYTVTNVAKVSRYDQQFWIVNLEGISDFVVVRAEEGDLQEVRHIQKSDIQN